MSEQSGIWRQKYKIENWVDLGIEFGYRTRGTQLQRCKLSALITSFHVKDIDILQSFLFLRTLKPVENTFVSFIGAGEGWHNYHHTFPWDYRAAELGSKYNITAHIIDFLAWIGQAYDLKVAPYSMIEHRAMKKGDGTHQVFGKKNGMTSQGDKLDSNENKLKDTSLDSYTAEEKQRLTTKG